MRVTARVRKIIAVGLIVSGSVSGALIAGAQGAGAIGPPHAAGPAQAHQVQCGSLTRQLNAAMLRLLQAERRNAPQGEIAAIQRDIAGLRAAIRGLSC
jgi:hypothetical protein